MFCICLIMISRNVFNLLKVAFREINGEKNAFQMFDNDFMKRFLSLKYLKVVF